MKLGITGHQNLGTSADWVKETLMGLVCSLKAQCGFTSLARGADQIFAQVLKEKVIPYMAIIPCLKYEQTFSDNLNLLNQYNDHLQHAKNVEIGCFQAPCGEAFLNTGKRVVDLSDKLIAVWNGQQSKNLGGTGDAVLYAQSIRKEIIHINPTSREVVSL